MVVTDEQTIGFSERLDWLKHIPFFEKKSGRHGPCILGKQDSITTSYITLQLAVLGEMKTHF